jgi:hypothetical protein
MLCLGHDYWHNPMLRMLSSEADEAQSHRNCPEQHSVLANIRDLRRRTADRRDLPVARTGRRFSELGAYFAVTDCKRTAAEAGEVGTIVKVPPTNIPNVAVFGQCKPRKSLYSP